MPATSSLRINSRRRARRSCPFSARAGRAEAGHYRTGYAHVGVRSRTMSDIFRGGHMLQNKWVVLAGSTVIFLAGLSAGSLLQSGIAHAQAAKHVFELR